MNELKTLKARQAFTKSVRDEEIKLLSREYNSILGKIVAIGYR